MADLRDMRAVSTVHQAKGFEYDHVAVHADLLDPQTDDERNVSFVAFTRHKRSLTIRCAPRAAPPNATMTEKAEAEEEQRRSQLALAAKKKVEEDEEDGAKRRAVMMALTPAAVTSESVTPLTAAVFVTAKPVPVDVTQAEIDARRAARLARQSNNPTKPKRRKTR